MSPSSSRTCGAISVPPPTGDPSAALTISTRSEQPTTTRGCQPLLISPWGPAFLASSQRVAQLTSTVEP